MNYANRNITEFLEREFDSNPGHPPKYNSEKRLLEYVDDNKYQQRNLDTTSKHEDPNKAIF